MQCRFQYPRALADEWIASTARELAEGSAYQVAITGHEGADEMLVGVAGVRLDAKARTGRIGYWVGRRFWGHGVAGEAAGRLARWAMANLPIDRLVAEVATDNPASAAVLRRIGFRETDEGVAQFVSRGGKHPVWQFLAHARRSAFGHAEVGPAAEAVGKPLLLVAACALVDSERPCAAGRAGRRARIAMAGLWGIPRGKTAFRARRGGGAGPIRELKEELGIDVSAACLAPFAFASHGRAVPPVRCRYIPCAGGGRALRGHGRARR